MINGWFIKYPEKALLVLAKWKSFHGCFFPTLIPCSYPMFAHRWCGLDFSFSLYILETLDHAIYLVLFHLFTYHLRPEWEKNHLNIATQQCRWWESNPGPQHSKRERYPLHHCLPAVEVKLALLAFRSYLLILTTINLNVFDSLQG